MPLLSHKPDAAEGPRLHRFARCQKLASALHVSFGPHSGRFKSELVAHPLQLGRRFRAIAPSQGAIRSFRCGPPVYPPRATSPSHAATFPIAFPRQSTILLLFFQGKSQEEVDWICDLPSDRQDSSLRLFCLLLRRRKAEGSPQRVRISAIQVEPLPREGSVSTGNNWRDSPGRMLG